MPDGRSPLRGSAAAAFTSQGLHYYPSETEIRTSRERAGGGRTEGRAADAGALLVDHKKQQYRVSSTGWGTFGVGIAFPFRLSGKWKLLHWEGEKCPQRARLLRRFLFRECRCGIFSIDAFSDYVGLELGRKGSRRKG